MPDQPARRHRRRHPHLWRGLFGDTARRGIRHQDAARLQFIHDLAAYPCLEGLAPARLTAPPWRADENARVLLVLAAATARDCVPMLPPSNTDCPPGPKILRQARMPGPEGACAPLRCTCRRLRRPSTSCSSTLQVLYDTSKSSGSFFSACDACQSAVLRLSPRTLQLDPCETNRRDRASASLILINNNCSPKTKYSPHSDWQAEL